MTVTFNNAHFNPPQECSICITPTAEGVVDEHGHAFHERCIKTWTEHSSTCPMCRRQVTAINGVAVRRIRQVNLPPLRDIIALGDMPYRPVVAAGGRGLRPARRNTPLAQRIVALILVVCLLPFVLSIVYIGTIAIAIAAVFAGIRNALRPRLAN